MRIDRMATYFNMKEAGTCNIRDWRSNLLPRMNNIYAKRIDRITADIISIHARYQHLTFVVVHKQAPNHFRICLLFVPGTRSF